jgi:hypothetical protein
MANGEIVGICIGATAGAKMIEVPEVFAEAGNGLVGDRYYNGKGSFNKGAAGKRQVTLMNTKFFEGPALPTPTADAISLQMVSNLWI